MGKVPPQLTPLKPKGDPYSDAVRSKRKGSSSDKRKRAQKISAIKRMNPENITEDWALRMVQSEEFSAVEIEKMIGNMLTRPIKPELRAKLIDTGIKAHTAFHGTKSKNINLNIDVVNIWEKMMERAKKELENEQSTS